MAVTADQLDWGRPRHAGVDRQRAFAGSYHLVRSAQLVRRLAAADVARVPRPAHLERAAREHLRLAKGFLGAIGFERGGRL